MREDAGEISSRQVSWSLVSYFTEFDISSKGIEDPG